MRDVSTAVLEPDAHATPATRCGAAVGRRLRIAAVSYALPRPGYKRGGIERVAHDLAHGLACRGHHVVVFSHDPAPPGALYEVAELPWRAFVSTWAGRRITMGYLGNLLSALPSFGDAQVIMAHGDSLLLPLRGRPVVRVMHGTALGEARSATSLGRRILQGGVYALEVLTALTQPHCVAVSANTLRGNPFVRQVIPNGVDLTVFRPDLSARAPLPTVLFVGALGGRKRGRWLVRQFRDHVRPRIPNAELHMVCEPGEPVAGVVYHTAVSDSVLGGLYRRSWVYAAPSTYEGFGLPFVEALACGTPVVATPNPGSLEVLRAGGGLLVPDPQFGGALCDLLLDAARRDEMSGVAVRRAEQFALDRTIDAYESLLLSVVNRRG